jgi:hypothetical protein
MGTAVRPAKTSPGPWDAFADVDGSWTKAGGTLGDGEGWHSAAAIGAKAAAGWSGVAQDGDGRSKRLTSTNSH